MMNKQASNLIKTSERTFKATQVFLSHACSQSSSALGRRVGSLWKHCSKKSFSGSEASSGIGGMSSSTIRNMTAKMKEKG
jgi:hypothetical protein